MEKKEDLFAKIAKLEGEILTLKEKEEELKQVKKQLANIEKSKEEIIANEHNIRQQLEKAKNELPTLQKIIEGKDKQIEAMKADLNKLANLFDEYIAAYQDQVKMLGVFVKNTQTVEKYLSGKINDFNGGSKK